MSAANDILTLLTGRPRRIQKTKHKCTVCGAKIPKGRRYTCGYRCKAVVDKKNKAFYAKRQRRRELLQKLEKGRSRASDGLGLLFEEGQ